MKVVLNKDWNVNSFKVIYLKLCYLKVRGGGGGAGQAHHQSQAKQRQRQT